MAISEGVRKKYVPTIGIETHVQLKTKTKLFSAVGNDARRSTIQKDLAVLFDERIRADDAGVVDHGIEQRVRAARGEDDVAAVGVDGAGVDGGSVQCG